MPTSGTTSFTVTRDDIIKASLRAIGQLGAGDSPTAEDYTNCSQALNILVKAMMVDGAELWTVTDITFPTVAGQAAYTIGSGGDVNTDRPLRIFHGLTQDSNGQQITLLPISRQEWEQYSDKVSQSIPNQYYYDPQLSLGTLRLLPVPADATHTITLTAQRPIQDFNASTDLPDFPQEWYQALKWGLADEVASEYGVSPTIMQMVAAKAAKYRKDMGDWSQEEASTFFTPNPQGLGRMRGYGGR